MDIEEFRESARQLVSTASGYHVLVETEDGVLFDSALVGTDSISVLCTALLSMLVSFSTSTGMPPTGQLVVRVTPIEEP